MTLYKIDKATINYLRDSYGKIAKTCFQIKFLERPSEYYEIEGYLYDLEMKTDNNNEEVETGNDNNNNLNIKVWRLKKTAKKLLG